VAVLRWGLLGTARINRLLIPAIRRSARSVVHAVASRDGARATAYSAEWAVPRAFASYDALLDSDVDIVYVPLPNSLHVPWTLRAIVSGKHVLCEKPLALSPADVDQVAVAAAAAGRVVTEGFMYRHHAQTARVQELLQQGAIGELRTVAASSSYMQNRPADVRLQPALGGGALWDIGCYPVSFAQLMAAAAVEHAVGWQHRGPSGVDEDVAGCVVYANGVVGQFFASFRAAHQTFARLTGTTGVIEVDRPFRPQPVERLRLRRDGGVEEIEVRGHHVFDDEVADMEDAVLGIRPARITLHESRTLAETLVALHDTARAGRPPWPS
jgi:D-xylose 1-dehydrogenase (NADP+, D-xylono-1,5-lactone-forming)